ncbi:MAG: 30S ribosomal protein S20 [Bacteroidia bacterium]|jgi:small subunit ribosomal protein S20|nr:30S ribosomal protein S20 [Bacteroidia bacterium]
MANHKSAIKRIRSNNAKKLSNRYRKKTVGTKLKNIHSIDKKDKYQKELPGVISSIDKLAGKNIYHKNKAANLKSKLMKRANALAKAGK